jgi:hypothetical protein
MNQQNKLPKFLYKYFSKAKYAECIFRHNELYFRNPKTFNDPFDCNPMLTSKRDFNEEDYVKFACQECPDNERQSCEVQAGKIYPTIDKNQKIKEFNEIIKKDLERSINEIRVLCLSENYNDILMWSHYADGHRGFVLQFDTNALLNNFKPDRPEQVIYPPKRSYPSLKEYNENNFTHMLLIAKSSQWTYEHEWRILKHVETEEELEEEGKLYPFEKGLITGIILGCKMTPQDKKKISQWRLRYQPQITPYEAIKDESSYNIKTVPEINE